MFDFPPNPTWDSLHVLIIHFPIALLLLSPLFIAISAVLKPPRGKPYMVAALIVLLLGTASLFVAGSTGHAAAELADRGGAIDPVLQMHEDLASKTQFTFAGLTVALLTVFLLPTVLRRGEIRLFSTTLPAAFLVVYTAGILLLVNTAHAGGRLVHEFGVHALVPVTNADNLDSAPQSETARNP